MTFGIDKFTIVISNKVKLEMTNQIKTIHVKNKIVGARRIL